MSGLLLAAAATTNLSSHLISIRSAIEASELAGPEVAAGPSNNVIQSDDQLVFGASQAAQMGLSDAPAEASTWAQLMAALFVDQQPGQQQQPGGWWQPNWLNLLLAAFLVLLMLTTAVGNLFVIVAILIERNLRTIGNYLVLSLAIADLLVALLVMPLAGIYQILDRWTLGVLLCDIWTSADVFCCTASILHLLAIALDRYWAVTRVDYIRCQRNERRILAMILFVWAAACVISLAPVFGWKDAQFEWRITQAKECLISQDVGYQIFATFTTFYFPLILTLIFYWKIYQVARKRIRRKLDNRLVKVNLQHPSKFPSTSNAPAATLMAAKGTATGSPAAKTNKLCQCPCHHDELRAKMMTDEKRRDVDSSHSHPPGRPGAEEPNGPNEASSDGGQSKCNKSNHNGNGNDNDIKPTRRDNVGDDKTSTQPAGQSKEQTAQAAHTEHIATFASCSRSSSARSASSSSGSSSGSSLVIGKRQKLKKCARPQPLSRHSHHCRASLGAKLDECPGCLCGRQFANRDELVGGEPNCCPTTRGQHREQQQVAHKRQDSLGDSNSSNLSQLSSSLMANSRPEGQQQQKQQHASLGRQSSEACDECCAACCCHGQTNMTATDLGPISQSAPTQTASTSQQQPPDADKNGPQLELEPNEKNPARTAIKQDSLVSINQRGQVCCDIVVVDEQTDEPGRPFDRPADAPKETTLLVTLGLHLVGWLRRLAPSNWRQLMTRTTTTDEQNKQTAIPNCTILVDERGQSSLVPAGQANGDAATDTCRQCKCPPGMDNHEGAQRHLTHNAFSLDEAEIQRASSSARQAGGMVIAVSTANIAVTTSVREPKSTAMTTTTTNQIGQQPTSTSAVQQSIEGVESKRERKAAKTLAIITGVFVMCWLPFFVMAITMPLLQLRPHKYVFAFLLWLGYANSMLNPIIYTIFSPDFRKAFNRLLCGLEDETPGKNRTSKGQRTAASKRHNNNNNSLAADWDQPDDHHESGYLAQVRHQLARIHPILAKLTCCCCCCCCHCCCPSKTTGSSWSSGSPPVSTSQQASRFHPKGARLAANDTKGSPQHLLLANNLHNSFEGSRGTTMDTTTGSMRTNSSSAGPTPVRQRPPVGPTTPTTQQATRPLLATRPFSSVTNDF